MIGFVVLHYLVDQETISTVNSILEKVKGAFVVVVDNNSPNKSYEAINRYYEGNSRVILLKNIGNTGYAGGINFGYNYIKKNMEVEFIVAMNNDMAIVENNFSEKIREAYNRTGFYVLGPDIYSTSALRHQNPETSRIRTLEEIEKNIQQLNKIKKKRMILTMKGILKRFSYIDRFYYLIKNFYKKTRKYEEELYNVTLHGSFYVFSKKYIEKRVYALYPNTDFYCEAQILDYECIRDGMLTIYDPSILIYHYEDKATNAVAGSYKRKMDKKIDKVLESLYVFKHLIEKDNKDGKNKK